MRRRRLIFIALAVVLLGAIAGGVFLAQRDTESHEESALASKPQAPPDLEKFRDNFASGIAALNRKDGADAVKHLSSFDFGPRAVEQYRMYHLANAYQLAGNAPAARATLAKLWRRKPAMAAYPDAALKLGGLYASGDDWEHAADVYASLAHRTDDPVVAGTARWELVEARFLDGDPAAMFDASRAMTVHSPRAKQVDDAIAVFRALTSVPEGQPLKLTHLERLDRAKNLMRDGDAKAALAELEALAPVAPASMKMELDLQRGLALRANGRYEDSNKVLEPLTSGYFKYAIPALRNAAQNYRVVSDSINPIVIKVVKEKKQVGTIKQRVGKGKKRRTVTKPKYAIVPKQIKLVDLAKKTKKDEYDRLATERLKDLLQLKQIDDDLRLDVLNALVARAITKNQTDYIRELVPQVIKIDPIADPALQYLWDKAWAAFARGDLNGAKPLFRFIADTYKHPNARRQSDYWYARTIERLGAKDEAKAIYRKLASAPYEDLYAIHATSRGAHEVEPTTNPLQIERPDWEQVAEKEMPGELRLAYELTALQQPAAALAEIQKNERRENRKYAQALLADYYNATGNRLFVYKSLRIAFPQLATVEQDSVPAYFVKMYYPIRYEDDIEKYSKRNGLDPNLVMALILQESYFNPKARSPVGATGLMQLMPPTAKELARRLHTSGNFANPSVNIELGTAHFKMLMNLFNGNQYLAVASYNGGQGNVMKWRRAAPGKPMDEFLESIPFPETRGYVKRVTMLKSTYARLRG